ALLDLLERAVLLVLALGVARLLAGLDLLRRALLAIAARSFGVVRHVIAPVALGQRLELLDRDLARPVVRGDRHRRGLRADPAVPDAEDREAEHRDDQHGDPPAPLLWHDHG